MMADIDYKVLIVFLPFVVSNCLQIHILDLNKYKIDFWRYITSTAENNYTSISIF